MVEKSPHPPTNRHTINNILKIPIAARNLQPWLLALPAETAFRTGIPALARVPPSVFPGGGSDVQPQVLYEHKLPAASSPASAPACGHSSKTRLFPAREQSPAPTGCSFQHLAGLCAVHAALFRFSTGFGTQSTTWLALPSAHPKHRQRKEHQGLF